MKNRLIAKTLVATLVFQNFAFADSRIDKVGNSAIENAQTEIKLLRGNLSDLDVQLSVLANYMIFHENDGGPGVALGLTGSASALLGSAITLVNAVALGKKSGAATEMGFMLNLFGTAESVAGYFFADLLPKDHANRTEDEFVRDVKTLINNADNILSVSKNDSLIETTLEIRKKVNKLEQLYAGQSDKQKSIEKKETVAILALAASGLITLSRLDVTFEFSRKDAAIISLGAAAAHIASIVYSTKSLDHEVLLKEIKSTRESISAALTAIN